MINYTELLVEAKFLDTKPPETHDMNLYVETWDCGTTSCALGDIGIRHGMTDETFCADEAMELLGLSFDSFGSMVYVFLFDCKSVFISGVLFNRSNETPHQTAARIRKFVHYRRKKEAIFAEYNEELQKGRHLFQGGVVDVAGEVLSELEAA